MLGDTAIAQDSVVAQNTSVGSDTAGVPDTVLDTVLVPIRYAEAGVGTAPP